MMEARESNRTQRLLIGSMFYQAVWFASVLSAGDPSRWWWGVGSTVAFLVYVLLAWPLLRQRVLTLTIAAILCGLVVDSLMIAARVWTTPRMWLPPPLPPLWLVMLWAAFGIYIALSMEVLYGRYGLAAVAGALGGMLAYRGGALAGAIHWGQPVWLGTLVLMAVWALAFPVLIRVATVVQERENGLRKAASRMHVALM